MTLQKFFVGWLLIWAADICLMIGAIRLGWELITLTTFEQVVRDILLIVCYLGIFVIPVVAYRHLRELKRKLYVSQRFVSRRERRQLLRRLRRFYC